MPLRGIHLPLIFILVLSLEAPCTSQAQGHRSGQIANISRMYAYEVVDGHRSERRQLQELHLTDAQGRTHTVGYFPPESPHGASWQWSFFEDTVLVRRDRYLDSTLAWRQVLIHDTVGRVVREEFFDMRGPTPVPTLIVRHRYDAQGRLTHSEGQAPGGRRIFQSRRKYHGSTRILRELRTKGETPYDSLSDRRIRRRDLLLDSNQRLIQAHETITDAQGKMRTHILRLEYNARGQVRQAERLRNRSHELIERTYYLFFPSGRYRGYNTYGPDGKLATSHEVESINYPTGQLRQPEMEAPW